MTVDLKIEFDEQQIAKLLKIPVLLRLAPAERVLKAMSKPILVHAKANAPDSRKPNKSGRPSRDKMSEESKKKWPESARNHLGVVYRKSEGGGYLVIGGKSPQANSLNFESGKKAGTRVLWDANKIRTMPRRYVPAKERFMQRALDETRQSQITAGNNQLEKELRELNIG
jgi:hypothetical protein